MRNIEYHAANIAFKMILYPKNKVYIAYKPLADKVTEILKMVLNNVEKNNAEINVQSDT